MTKCIIKRNTGKYVQSFKYSNCYAFYEILKDKYKKDAEFFQNRYIKPNHSFNADYPFYG